MAPVTSSTAISTNNGVGVGVGVGGTFLTAVSARKEREKGAQVNLKKRFYFDFIHFFKFFKFIKKFKFKNFQFQKNEKMFKLKKI